MAIQAMHTAATGLSALSTGIDVIANNLANVNTKGFKATRANFEDLFYQERQMAGAANYEGIAKPTGLFVGLGTQVSNTQMLFEQGSLEQTGRTTDLAISGNGFFQVQIYEDVGGGIGYTRAGNFEVNRDGELVLNNGAGFRLEPGIQVPMNFSKLNIGDDGQVTAIIDGEAQEVGRVELVRFTNPQGLEPIGGNIFISTEASGDPIVGEPGSDGLGVIRSGFLENSNVDAVRELVDLIKAQRSFELNSKVITTGNEMLQTVTHLKQ